jgi:diguanylate cyclase (GGDEF)-like protein
MSKKNSSVPSSTRLRLRRIFTLGDLGLAPRLALAFATVVVLAVCFNFIVERGVTAVEYVTQKDGRTASRTSSATSSIAGGKSDNAVTPSALYQALGNYDRTVREQIEGKSKLSTPQYSKAEAALKRIAAEYGASSSSAPALVVSSVENHIRTGEDLLRVAQASNTGLANYSAIFASMDARLQHSIDSAWKILGRVIARQSLLKLDAQLDAIQDSFGTRDDSMKASEGWARVAASEDAFFKTLQLNENTLRRSQGAEWYTGLRADFTALTQARIALARAEKRKGELAQTFTGESALMAEMLSHSGVRDAAVPAREIVSRETMSTALPTSLPITEASQASPASTRTMLAWVCGIALAVMGYICIVTVLSVVRPVRRLLRATHQLAEGNTVSPVRSGGIRELNALSVAFNSMAEQIEVARAANREANLSLEAKVEERTRQLQELAERDPLTGLANRRQLFAALKTSIGRAAATKRRVGVFFFDIDNFKTLNDSLGHAYGDRVLTAIARRLEAIALTFGFASRLGGDEFMLVHDAAQSIEEIVASGTRIVNGFHAPLQIEGRELIVSVSVGVSVYPDHEREVEALLRAADAALFSAKAQGRSQLVLFTPELLIAASAKFGIEQRLRRAIEKGEFELFYQPEVSVQGFEVSLVEALIRWRMPDGSYQTPTDFLAVAEESGLIMEINDWVLRTAIGAASEWHHGEWPNARVAINVSPRQFLDFRFVEKLQGLLSEFDLPARCLELELTESVLQTGATTLKALSQLRAIGVAIALDDFGTGYSSMSSLEQLPLTRIKLDRSLIARMDSNRRSESIANATIGLCGELGLSVTAEGVERLAQFTMLLGFPGMSLQGYLVARPVTFDRVLPLLKQLPSHCQELLLLSQRRDEASEKSMPDIAAREVSEVAQG